MKRVFSDVWETGVESPFPGLTTHSYLLIRNSGNVLFYNTGNLQEIEAMAELGGVAYQFLSHRDELGNTLNVIGERYGAKLGGHRDEQEQFAKVRVPDILFMRRETLFGDIEVIPTPGHSPGSTCFLAHSSGGKRYLFTGDTVYRAAGGEWKAGFIPGYSREEDKVTLAESLGLLKTLRPDVVFSSAFGGDAGYEEVTPRMWSRYLDNAVDALLK